MKQQSTELTNALQHLRKARQLLDSRSVLEVAGQDRHNHLKSNLMSIERELVADREEELRNDPASRKDGVRGTDEDLAAVTV